jgi:DNA polymerase type B, organellar and viral
MVAKNKTNTSISAPSLVKAKEKPKYQLIKVTVPFNEFTEIRFIQLLMVNLKINSLNTIIFQYNSYSTFTNLMLGPQVGIVVKDNHNISYYRILFEHYIEKLESIMSLYNVGIPDFIFIYFKEILVEDKIKIGQLFQIDLPKKLINVSDTKTKFNSKILPLTLDERNFGYLLQDSIKANYLEKIINNLQENILLNTSDSEKNKILNEIKELGLDLKNIEFQPLLRERLKDEKLQIAFLMEVIKSDTYKVFISKNKLYLIISFLTKKFNYNRIVFHNKTGKLMFCSKDSFNNENLLFLNKDISNYFIREIGNVSVALNKYNDIELFIKKIDLPAIKYTEHIKFINQDVASDNSNSDKGKPIPIRNTNFGVFDVETFIDTSEDGEKISRVFALGFGIYMGKVSMYYLSDYFDNTTESSNKLVIKCIDDMLIPDYHKYIFYVHNFGRFDAIFLHKILLDYNLHVEEKNQYKLVPLYRDNKMIKLEVRKIVEKKVIKISFVDSLNILNDKLEKLCEDFSVNTTKGIFPYSFVNKDNLDYIGPRPNISYYNKNVKMDLDNENKVNNWSLRAETLKYLERDLISLLEILEKFQEVLWLDHNIELIGNLTIAGLAKTKFMKYYLKDSKIPLINTNNLFQFIYDGYYGGITEVYRPHGKNLTYTDVNSLYPYAALNPMPGLNCQWLESYNSEGLDLSKLFGVFYAKVITNGDYLGLLPVRTKSGLIFPRGKFDGI